jgi:hypothetical protein
MMMKKPNSGSSSSRKANDHAPNALPPKKLPAPDALPPSPPSPDAAAAMVTHMLAEAERAAARAENKAALREALGKQVRELVAERFSTAEATAIIMASSSGSGKAPAAAQNRLTKVLEADLARMRHRGIQISKGTSFFNCLKSIDRGQVLVYIPVTVSCLQQCSFKARILLKE